MEEYVIRQYRNLCMDQLVLKQYAKFIDILFRQEKRVLFCGIAELERTCTGIGTAFLLSLLGVEEDVIYEDHCAQTVIWSPNWYICRDLSDLAGGR